MIKRNITSTENNNFIVSLIIIYNSKKIAQKVIKCVNLRCQKLKIKKMKA